jgi:hypothetical protein
MLMHDRPLAVDFAEAKGRAKPQVLRAASHSSQKLLYDFASRIPSYSPDFSDMTSVCSASLIRRTRKYPQDIFIDLLNLSGLPTKLAKLKEKFKLGLFFAHHRAISRWR